MLKRGRGHGTGHKNSRMWTVKEDHSSVWIKLPDKKHPYKKKKGWIREFEKKFIITELEALEYFDDNGNWKEE